MSHAHQSRDGAHDSSVVDRSLLVATLFAIATFVFHFARAGAYGYQRDELYFISCARHLAFGYVDQPPLIAIITKFVVATFGESLYGLRFLPAVAAAATVVVVGRLARRLGGGVWAQGVAMLGVAIAPFSLATGNLLTMNAFEPLLWLCAAYVLAEAIERDRPLVWAALGLTSGIALINKYSMFFFVVSCVVGIVCSRERAVLRRPGFALAACLAGLIVAPTLVWQAAHGWPQLELLRNAARVKNINEGPVLFYLQQTLLMGPLAAPLWLAGLAGFLFAPSLRAWRWYGLAYIVLSIVYAALQAKVYYLAPIYPALFAAGGVVVEARVRAVRFVRIAYPALVLASGLAIAPQAFPLLPLDAFVAYERLLDLRGVKMEKHPVGLVPQQFADMLGWYTLVDTLALAYDALPAGQRREAVVLTQNYGQASAVDVLGRGRGLPPALSGHNNYYLYGTRGASGNVVLSIGIPRELLAREYRDVRRVATYRDPYVLPDSNDLPIYACTRPREPLVRFWPNFKRYV